MKLNKLFFLFKAKSYFCKDFSKKGWKTDMQILLRSLNRM